MYKIIENGDTLAMTEAPTYVRRADNGCFVLCAEAEATGIAHAGASAASGENADEHKPGQSQCCESLFHVFPPY